VSDVHLSRDHSSDQLTAWCGLSEAADRDVEIGSELFETTCIACLNVITQFGDLADSRIRQLHLGTANADGFSEVTQCSNWGYWDALDGRMLEDGDVVIVRYPDGTERIGPVTIDERFFMMMDNGREFRTENCVASMEFEFHGAKANLPLRGMLAKRKVSK